MTGPAAPAHVVMVVANDVTADTRVRKSALAVAALGVRVTIVGIAVGPRREVSRLGPVEILRVPVDFVLRDRRRQRRSRWHRGEIGALAADPQAEALRRRRLALAQRRAEVAGGLTGTLSRAAVDARRSAVRAAGLGRRKAARAATLAFKVYDRGVQSLPLGADSGRVVPEVDDLELAIGPVLDELAPDAIHAHDVHFLAVVGRHVARRRLAGEHVPWVYDAHEWVPGLSRYGGRTARVVAAWAGLERDWIRRADRVITVSPPLAQGLQERYRLPHRPDLVLNVPPLATGGAGPARPGSASADAAPPPDPAQLTATGVNDVRSAVGVPDDALLLVYSGGVQAARGVETAVEALVHLPDAHLAVVAVPSVQSPAVTAVRARAEQLGVADRLHLVEAVRPDRVVDFLRTADVGLIPLRHFGSHEMALANKLFEYLHAGVAMVVSDCRAQADFVREHGVGEVHRAGDGADLAAAVRRVLARREQVRAALADPGLLAAYTWDAQARVLQNVYRELLPEAELPREVAPLPAAEPPERTVPAVGRTLVVGPANSAGQAWAWTRCAARYLDGVTGWTVALRNDRYDYPADELVAPQDYLADAGWQLRTLARARTGWTHVLLEAGRPVLGGLAGRDFVGDAELLRRSGIEVGLVFHGSEVRDPRRHRARHEFSPFADPADVLTRRLQTRCDALLPLVADFDGPLFASTPDQLDYLPDHARWLPVVVDTGIFTPTGVPAPLDAAARARPLVVHAPSNPALKGTEFVQRELGPLHEQGVIELRMVTGLPPTQAAELVRTADIVVDQLLLGLYGVLACEAMAAGRIVVGYLGEALRRRVPSAVPMLEATPSTVGEVVRRVLQVPGEARAAAAAGPAFVAQFHDGRRSASVLAPFLGVQGLAPDPVADLDPDLAPNPAEVESR